MRSLKLAMLVGCGAKVLVSVAREALNTRMMKTRWSAVGHGQICGRIAGAECSLSRSVSRKPERARLRPRGAGAGIVPAPSWHKPGRSGLRRRHEIKHWESARLSILESPPADPDSPDQMPDAWR